LTTGLWLLLKAPAAAHFVCSLPRDDPFGDLSCPTLFKHLKAHLLHQQKQISIGADDAGDGCKTIWFLPLFLRLKIKNSHPHYFYTTNYNYNNYLDFRTKYQVK
jgi:hypothetical protein